MLSTGPWTGTVNCNNLLCGKQTSSFLVSSWAAAELKSKSQNLSKTIWQHEAEAGCHESFPSCHSRPEEPPSMFYILIATIPMMQGACFGLRWYDKISIKRPKIYSASSANKYYTMLSLSIYHPANDQLYEVQQGFIAAEPVLTLRFLLQGTLGFVAYKNFHSKP